MEVVQHDGTNPVLAEAVHVDMPSAIPTEMVVVPDQEPGPHFWR